MKAEDLVASWLRGGRAAASAEGLALAPRSDGALAEKLRRAYDWIAREAIVSPYHDIEFGEGLSLGRSGNASQRVELHASSYSSYILLPLLNLATSQRLLFIGAPGRGKTSMAILMGLLAGHALADVKRSVQRGHPQLTIPDLLGSPLPSEMIRAEDPKAIRVAWRGWLTMRVKIIDEYNRIPTKTQSALLSLMAEGYAEMFEQVVECGWSAWYLTANDDLGGGTFPVIEALKDRIDIVVRCTPFNAHYLDTLVDRVKTARRPLEFVPSDIIFTPAELDRIEQEIRAVALPAAVRDGLGFFAGQLEFCRRASDRLEFMQKDTLHLAGLKVAQVCNEECPLDKQTNICSQTENGVSARAYQTLILFAKALAYFRGAAEVSNEDVRQILPWILHDKLKPNAASPFFQRPENQPLASDRATWIREMFDQAQRQLAAYAHIRPPVAQMRAELEQGVDGLARGDIEKRLRAIEEAIESTMNRAELNGPVYEDLIVLKSLHVHYRRALEAQGQAQGRRP
jgi:MoxR-like ATPase